MANKTLADLRTAALQLSNYETSGFVQTPELSARANEAIGAYYDLVLTSRETYFRASFPFTLAGGFSGNTVALPADLDKVQALDFNPGTSSVCPVPTLPSFRERHTVGYRCYDWTPGTLTIFPPNASAGNYELLYTPICPVLADRLTATTSYPTTAIDATGGAADGTLHNWFFPSGAFDSSYIGRFLYVTGAANSVNNGFHGITSVPDGTDLRTVGYPVASESFGGGVTAAVYTGPLDAVTVGPGANWTFAHADFTQADIGSEIVVSGSQASDGTYTIVNITGPSTCQTTQGAVVADEFFAPGVTVQYQPSGTVYALPDTLQSGALWIELFIAAGILDKAEQDSSALQARLAVQTKRITDDKRWKQDEPKQVPLVRRRGLGRWAY